MTVFIDSNSGATEWVGSLAYIAGDIVNTKTVDDDLPTVYECSIGGTSGNTEPEVSPGTSWAVSTAYSLNTLRASTLDDQPVIFKCTTAGTSDVTEPAWDSVLGNTTADGTVVWTATSWWRINTGDLVSDGTLTWVAKLPITWQYAMITFSRGVRAWYNIADSSTDIYCELLHYETAGTNLTLSGPPFDYTLNPSVYRVNKLTGLYAPALTDGSTNINFEAGGFGWVQIQPRVAMFGFNIKARANFQPRLQQFEDCVIEYGIDQVGRFQMSIEADIRLIACKVTSNSQPNSNLSLISDGYITMEACDFDIDSPAVGWIKTEAAVVTHTVTIHDCDMSNFTNPALIDSLALGNDSTPSFAKSTVLKATITDSLLPDGFTVWNNVEWVASMASFVEVRDCSDSTNTLMLNKYKDVGGERYTEFTIVRPDGYFDEASSTLVSEVLSPDIDCRPSLPLVSSRMGVFVESAGAKVFSIEMIENYSAPLTAKELWVELHYYQGSSPLYTVDTSSKEYAQLTYTAIQAGAGLTTWDNVPVGYRSIKVEIPVTVSRIGLAYAVVRVGRFEVGKDVVLDTTLRYTE